MSDVIAEILRNEGGYQNSKSDAANKNSRGEWVGTNRGITPAVYEEYTGRVPTAKDMRKLSKDLAVDIYEEKYIEPIKRNLEVDEKHPAFTQLVDMAVNHGYSGMVAMVQRTLGTAVDGKAGPETRERLAGAGDINNELVETRLAEYNRITQSMPETKAFLPGWSKRAERFRREDGESESKSDPVAGNGVSGPKPIQGSRGRPTDG